MLYHQWLFTNAQRLVTGAEILWLAVLAYVVSDGAPLLFIDYPVFIIGALFAAIVWFIGVVGDVVRQPGQRLQYVLSLRWPIWWVREPTVALVALALFVTPIAFDVRLGLSAPFVSRAAQEVLSGKTAPESLTGARIGLFMVSQVDRAGDAVRFITGPCSLVDTCGFVYSPAGKPPVIGEDSYKHLWGPWWQWYQSW